MKKIVYKIINSNHDHIQLLHVDKDLIGMDNIYYSDIHKIRIISDCKPEYNEEEDILYIWGCQYECNNEIIKVSPAVLATIDEFNNLYHNPFFNNKEEIDSSEVMF